MYADINGLKMFYEIRGASDPGQVPLVLLPGAISATGTSFGRLPVQAMADDTLALLASLGIGQADLFGYSLGAGIALNIITRHPTAVRKAVLASVTFDKTGLHPEMFGGPGPWETADKPGH